MQDSQIQERTETATALTEYHRTWAMQGEDEDDVLLPRVVLHQGDISESRHGRHPKGTLINSGTGEVIESRRFVPITGFKTWIKYGENIGDPVEYCTRDKSQVPPEDLQWKDGQPPATQLFRNVVVLFEDMTTPTCFSLKDSSRHQRQSGKMLNQCEKARSAQKKSPGLYEIEVVDASNARGSWKDLRVKPVGDPSEELCKLALTWFDALQVKNVEVETEGVPF